MGPHNVYIAIFFVTGAMQVPTKSQNPTVCGWGDPFYSYFLRVSSISTFLKVIQAPKEGENQVTQKWISPISGGSPFLQYLIHLLFWGGFGAWMTFKKAEVEEILRK